MRFFICPEPFMRGIATDKKAVAMNGDGEVDSDFGSYGITP